MYSIIKGKIVDSYGDTVILLNNGIGYEIKTSDKYPKLTDFHEFDKILRQEITMYTKLIHTDNKMDLYGFESYVQRDGFCNLIQMPGIGPAAALNILKEYEYEDFITAVQNKQPIKIKGIGPKALKTIAEKIK